MQSSIIGGMSWCSSEGGNWVKHAGLTPSVRVGSFLKVEISLRMRGGTFCKPVVLSSTGMATACRTKVRKQKKSSIMED